MRSLFMKTGIGQYRKMLIAVAGIALASLPVTACTSSQSTSKQNANFLPVGIYIGCEDETPTTSRINFDYVVNVNPPSSIKECVDREKSIQGIYPEKIELALGKSSRLWSLILILKNNDALSISALSKGNVGKNILVIVKGRVVAKSVLNGQFSGKRFYISVNSEREGELMATQFMSTPSSQ